MTMRVSQIQINLVLLDEFDAPRNAHPITFVGDGEATAVEKAATFIRELPKKLEELTTAQPD